MKWPTSSFQINTFFQSCTLTNGFFLKSYISRIKFLGENIKNWLSYDFFVKKVIFHVFVRLLFF